MDELLRTLVASLGTTGIVVVILGWLLHRYLDRQLNARFQVLETQLRGEAETAVGLRRRRLEKTAELIQQLQQAGSACRNSLRSIRETLAEKSIQEFGQHRETFVDVLYGAQLLLQPQTYELAHRFKGTLDKAFILLGDRVEESRKADVSRGMERVMTDLDQLYPLLQEGLRGDLLALEHLPGGRPR